MKKNSLHWQVFYAMVLGCVIGFIFKSTGDYVISNFLYELITLCGVLFIRLLKMVMVPLIFTSIIIGVSSIGSGRKVGRLSIKTFLYYLLTSLIAIIIGLFLSNLIQPGIGATIVENTSFDSSKIQTSASPADILIRMIPTNPIQSLASGDMLGIIFFAIFFGFVINRIDSKKSSALKNVIDSIFNQ